MRLLATRLPTIHKISLYHTKLQLHPVGEAIERQSESILNTLNQTKCILSKSLGINRNRNKREAGVTAHNVAEKT
jgi:hypothetical protein